VDAQWPWDPSHAWPGDGLGVDGEGQEKTR
jgi:hypothetical protein